MPTNPEIRPALSRWVPLLPHQETVDVGRFPVKIHYRGHSGDKIANPVRSHTDGTMGRDSQRAHYLTAQLVTGVSQYPKARVGL